jgi:hypothetical protein
LIDRATDPTSWLMQFHFRDQWTVPTQPSAANENQFQVRPTIPFLAWDHVNIFRAEINYNIKNAGGNGLSNIKLFEALIVEERVAGESAPTSNSNPIHRVQRSSLSAQSHLLPTSRSIGR